MKKYLFFLFIFTLAGSALFAQNSPSQRKYVELLVTPDHPDWNYRMGQPAKVTIQVFCAGSPVDAEAVYEVGPEMLPPDSKGTISLRGGRAELDLGTMDHPGFRVAKITVTIEGKRYSDQVKVAYSPESIEPTVRMPADFMSFWDKAKADAAAVPMDAQVTLLSDYCTETVDVYLVNLQNYPAKQRIYGFLCKPKTPGKYPVLMSPPGAGVKKIGPERQYADAGFISLNIEIHGLNPTAQMDYGDIGRAIGPYQMNGMDDRDHYYYKKVYLGCVRAIDYLCSLPEWDGRNVVVTGGSQGGALSMVAAALDARITAVSAFYPALCDIEGYLHGRAGGWPGMFTGKNRDYTNTPDKVRTISYYDVVNFARIIKVPGFYSFGYNDNTCPPTSVYAAVNSVQAPKTVEVTPNSGHWRYGETNARSMEFLRRQCGLE